MGPGVRRDDVDRYDFAFSRRDAPGVLLETLPSKNRGRREDRMRAAPAVSRAMCIKECCTRAYRFSGEHPAFPAQWLYGLLRARPGDRLSCHHHSRRTFVPVHLTPAPGRQAHTTSPYAQAALVSRSLRVHRSPCPSFATMAYAPLAGQDGGSPTTDLPDGPSGIFFREGLDRLW
jgi:hypothetical protein